MTDIIERARELLAQAQSDTPPDAFALPTANIASICRALIVQTEAHAVKSAEHTL